MPKTKEQKRKEAHIRKCISDLRHYIRLVYQTFPGGKDYQELVKSGYSREYVFTRTYHALLHLKDRLDVDVKLQDFLFDITDNHGVGPVSLDRLVSHLSEMRVIKWASENGAIISFVPERHEAILRLHADVKNYVEEFKQYLTRNS